MLSIASLSAGKEHYYAKLARESYYTDGGEPPGRWWGESAELLGLVGQVEPEELSNIANGMSPSGARALVRNAKGKTRRAGFDLTFSAPKSVSVLWSQSDAELRAAIEKAQRSAVEAALSYLEEEACRSRRGRAGVDDVKSSFVASLFDHCSARAAMNGVPDPQLHCHALIWNVTHGEDGQWGTLDGRNLFWQKMAAGVLYRAELFHQLRKLGLSASRIGKFCQLDGIPDHVLRAFSKRRAAIEAELHEKGDYSAQASANAATNTRKSKTEVFREELLEDWKRQAEAMGFQFEQGMGPPLQAVDPEAELNRAIPKALGALTETKSYFCKRDLLRAVAEQVEPLGISIADIRKTVDAWLPRLVSLEATQLGEARFTTRNMVFLERQLVSGAKVLGRRRHRVSDNDLATALKSADARLAPEQRNALEHITQGSSIAMVSGLAGTGKTTLLRAAREAWERAGFKVHGAALAAQAARGLEEGSLIKSSSIHRTLHEIEKGRLRLDRHTVLVVDEASMVGTRLLERLISEVERAGAKLVLVGDERQLQAIEAGTPFAALAERLGCVKLTAIKRQTADWARRAAEAFSAGRIQDALGEYAKRGLVHVANSRSKAIDRLTADWKEAVRVVGLSETLVLTGTRQEAYRVNKAIQRERYLAGEVNGDAVATENELIFCGDRVRFRRNARNTGVLNGDVGTVVGLSTEARTLTVELADGKRVEIDLETYADIEVGYAGTTHSAQGATVDRCLVLCSAKMQGRAMTYVQASRAREETRFYVDRATAGKNLEKLTRSMEREDDRGMAIDLVPRRAA